MSSHFEPGTQVDLQAANVLGGQAVVIGLETLDLAKIHDEAMVALELSGRAGSRRAGMTRRAAAFFTEVIRSIEATHRTTLEVRADLKKVTESLAQRTRELAVS